MANVVRGLLVTLGLDAAEYTAGLSKAEYQAKKTLENISRSAQSVAGTLRTIGAAFGVSIGVGAFVHLIKSTIDAAEHLENLSKSTGIAVTTLGGLGFAATQTGSSLDGMASAFKKFNVNASAAAAGNETQLESFRALGITLKDLQTLTPDQLFIKAAAAFASFNEGADKAARGSEIFGKAYQDILPTLDQGAEKLQQNIAYFEKFGGVTSDVAKGASEFNTELAKLGLLQGAFARNLTADLLPQMRVLVEYLVNAREKSDQFSSSAKQTSDVITNLAVGVAYLSHWFIGLGEAIGAAAARMDRWAHLDFKGASFIAEDEGQRVDEAGKRFDALVAKIRGAQNEFKDKQIFGSDLTTGGTKIDPTRKPRTGATAGADDPTRKILEAALAALKANTEQEKAVLQNREQYLQASFDRGNIALAAYYSEKQAAQDEDLRRTTVNYLEQIRLIDRFIATAKTQKDKAQGEKEKVAATSAQQLAIIQAAGRAQQLLDQQERSLREYARTLDEVNAQMLELQGNTAAAASIRFTNQQAELRRGLQAVVDDPTSTQTATAAARLALDRLSQTEKMVQKQADLNEVTSKYALILGQAGIESAKIDLLAQTGAVTEIESLNRKAAIATQYVGLLKEQAEAYEKIANSPAFKGTATGNALLLQAQQMRLAIDQLAAATEALNNKFREAFEGPFADALLSLETRAKSFKDTLKDLFKSLETNLLNIANKNISEQLFGKGGALGGIPEFFGKAFGGGTKGIFGGAGEATGAAALTGAGATLTASGATLAAAGISLDAAAIAITSAAGTLAAGGAASSLGGGSSFVSELFSGFGAFASGGTPPVGRMSIVGERGPELFMPKSSGTIIPFDALKRGRGKSVTVHVNATFAGQMSTKSATQAGRELGLQINRAVSRS